MALMLGRVYDALTASGIDPAKAREAAEEVARFHTDLALVRSELAVVKLMAGVNLTLTLLVVGVLAGTFWQVTSLTREVAALASRLQ